MWEKFNSIYNYNLTLFYPYKYFLSYPNWALVKINYEIVLQNHDMEISSHIHSYVPTIQVPTLLLNNPCYVPTIQVPTCSITSQFLTGRAAFNNKIHTHIYILNHYTSFTCQNIIQFLHVSKPGLYMPNQKNQGINLWRVNKKTQLYPKINSNIITSAWQLQQKTFFQRHLLLLICSHELRFTIITGTNHTVQNCKGRFIIKDKQTLDDND